MTTSNDNSDGKIWSDSTTKVFINIMVDEFTKGNMPNGSFQPPTWTAMTNKLNSLTDRNFTRHQMKQKMNRMRTTYREFNLLLQNTGFGWDAATNSVTAEAEVWKNYLKVHPKATQFHKKGCDYYKELDMLFAKNTASGVLHHSSNQDPPNSDEERELDNQYLNAAGSNVHVDDSSDDDIREVELSTRSGKRKIQVRNGKSKKSTSQNMGDAIAAYTEAQIAKAELFKRKHGGMEATSPLVTPVQKDSDCSLTNCVTVLEGLGDISDDIYMKALEKFLEQPKWMEIFLAMSDDRRHAWLSRIF